MKNVSSGTEGFAGTAFARIAKALPGTLAGRNGTAAERGVNVAGIALIFFANVGDSTTGSAMARLGFSVGDADRTSSFAV
jgi:hypothetical protein